MVPSRCEGAIHGLNAWQLVCPSPEAAVVESAEPEDDVDAVFEVVPSAAVVVVESGESEDVVEAVDVVPSAGTRDKQVTP